MGQLFGMIPSEKALNGNSQLNSTLTLTPLNANQLRVYMNANP
jgi:hypothetical protein